MSTVSYPDIIGEYIANPERLETGGVQYVGYFEPTQIAPQQVANLFLFMQNTLDVPVAVVVQVTLPLVGGGLFKSGKPILSVAKPAFNLQLTEVEAGLLTLPVTTTEDAQPGEFEVAVELQVTPKSKGNRVRAAESQSKLDNKSLIDNIVGLNLASTLGATFSEKPVKKATFPLQIAGKPQPAERAPKLAHTYQAVWTRDQIDLFHRAIHEINLRQVKLKNELTAEALYARLYSESVSRFADVGLPLRIGEAIILAKILTFTCQYFLSNPARYNGLLVPIWERALDANADTTDALEVISSVGYYHLLRLSIAVGFGLIARAAGRQLWALEERQAVNDYIADNIETGQTLEEEFLYLPLLIAGTYISNKLTFAGEDLRNSLALIRKAYEARADLFLDDDMAQASQVYHHIFKKALETL
ncbi:MAG: hypothetical protein JW953_23155 [Anaerolineae bacterium]|nr:hypothetical protein [Anaerolineae bacterium]